VLSGTYLNSISQSRCCDDDWQGYLREAKCHLAMGEIATAIIAYNKVLQLEPQNTAAKTEVSHIQIFCYFAYFGS